MENTQIKGKHAFIEREVKHCLTQAMAVGFDKTPPQNRLDTLIELWIEDFESIADEWEHDTDAGRITQAFAAYRKENSRFPLFSALVEYLPKRQSEELALLPKPAQLATQETAEKHLKAIRMILASGELRRRLKAIQHNGYSFLDNVRALLQADPELKAECLAALDNPPKKGNFGTFRTFAECLM